MTYIQCCNIIHHVLCLRNWVFRRWWWHHISLTCAWLNWLVSLMKIYFPRQRPYKAPTSWNPACHLNGGWWRGQNLWSPQLMALGRTPENDLICHIPWWWKNYHRFWVYLCIVWMAGCHFQKNLTCQGAIFAQNCFNFLRLAWIQHLRAFSGVLLWPIAQSKCHKNWSWNTKQMSFFSEYNMKQSVLGKN